MAGVSQPIHAQGHAAANLHTVYFGVNALRDCTASLAPQYASQMGTLATGQPDSLITIWDQVRQILTHAAPQIKQTKKRVPFAAALDTVTHTNESGAQFKSERGHSTGRSGERGRGRSNLYPTLQPLHPFPSC